MKRKWGTLLLCLIMVASLLTACGGKNNGGSAGNGGSQGSTGGNTQQNTDSGATQQPQEQPVTIKFHHWYDDETESFGKVLAAFNEKYPHITVESVPLAVNDANETMKHIDLAAASNEDMDVLFINSPSNYAQRVGLDMLEPLDDYLAADGIAFDDEFKLDTRVDGKIYSFPGKLNVSFVLLNKNHLAEAGLPVPKEWTWDEYLDYAKKLTQGEGVNKRYGTYYHTWMDYIKLALMNQMENSNVVRDDGVTSNMDNPLVRKSLEIRQRSMEDDSATPYDVTLTQKLGYRDQLFGEKVSMIMTGSWMIAEAGGLGPTQPTSPYAFAPYPKANASDPSTTPVGADFIGVYSKSKNKQAAYTFAKWFATEGVVVQAKYLSSWKQSDTKAIVDTLVAATPMPELIDKESLVYTLDTMVAQKLYVPVAYQAEVEKAYTAEAERFLLGGVGLDETLEALKKAVQDVIDANK